MLRPRTRASLEAMRGRGAYVIVVTGRMYRAVRRYLTGPEPVVGYQGALVADPSTNEFLLHVPIPVELAREAIAAVQDSGHGLNCYVDDEALRGGGDAGGRAVRDLSAPRAARRGAVARLARATADEARHRR